jgi:hypothetical protein
MTDERCKVRCLVDFVGMENKEDGTKKELINGWGRGDVSDLRFSQRNCGKYHLL